MEILASQSSFGMTVRISLRNRRGRIDERAIIKVSTQPEEVAGDLADEFQTPQQLSTSR